MSEFVCEVCGKSFDTPQARGGHAHWAHEVEQGFTEQELVNELIEVAESLGTTPTAIQMRKHGAYSVRTYQNHFGGWNDALKAANLEPNCEKSIPAETLREDICRVADELDRTPSSIDIQRHGEYCVDTYRARFGNWASALQAAGFESRRSYVKEEPSWYGPNWSEQRKLALERDNFTCQHPGCSTSREDNQQSSGTDLHVHHLRPFRWYVAQHGEDAYIHANKLSNLLTICSSHHPLWEMFSPIVLSLFEGW